MVLRDGQYAVDDYVTIIVYLHYSLSVFENTVVAKVMFLHVCVILFTGGEGVSSQGPGRENTPPPGPGRENPPPGPGRENTPPKRTAAYGQ